MLTDNIGQLYSIHVVRNVCTITWPDQTTTEAPLSTVEPILDELMIAVLLRKVGPVTLAEAELISTA